MKRVLIIALAILTAFSANAQNVSKGYAVTDSVVYRPSAALDSTLKGKNIISLLPSKAKGGKADVKVYQSQAIINALGKHIESNSSRTISGYRIRIYFDNSQNARGASESALARFASNHPGIAAYRSYQSPYFKVTVGDFRTKSEAMELLERIKGEFPTAFILKENINYPVVDKHKAYVTDTLKVVRKVTKI